jgi:hypothetical protein
MIAHLRKVSPRRRYRRVVEGVWGPVAGSHEDGSSRMDEDQLGADIGAAVLGHPVVEHGFELGCSGM